MERLEEFPFIAMKTCETNAKSALSDLPHIQKTYIILFPFIKDRQGLPSMLQDYGEGKPHNPNSVFKNKEDAIEHFSKEETKKKFSEQLQNYFANICRVNRRKKRMISERIQGHH